MSHLIDITKPGRRPKEALDGNVTDLKMPFPTSKSINQLVEDVLCIALLTKSSQLCSGSCNSASRLVMLYCVFFDRDSSTHISERFMVTLGYGGSCKLYWDLEDKHLMPSEERVN